MTTSTDTTPRWLREIIALGACEAAVTWARGYETAEAMWAACERTDWMLWLVGRRAGPEGSPSRMEIVTVACEIARLVLPIFEKKYPKDDRPRKAIECAERYAQGKASAKEARAADAAAYAAYAAYAAADAAAAAAAAAADAAYAAAGKDIKVKILAILRRHYPTMPEATK